MRASRFYWSKAQIVLLTAAIACTSDGPNAPPFVAVDGLQIAFAHSGDGAIKVRWLDRISNEWKSGDPPSVAASEGVGAASTPDGIMNIVVWTAGTSTLRFAWGFQGLFDTSADAQTSQPALSSPVVVSAPEKYNWLIAFRTTGARIALRHYNNTTKAFADFDYAPIENAANSEVLGTPVLARSGNTIVLGWLRNAEMRFAVGTLDAAGVPTWQQKFALTFPREVFGGCFTQPLAASLAGAGGKFYLVVRRSTIACGTDPGGGLSSDHLFLFSSPDGATWDTDSPIGSRGSVELYSGRPAIAGWDDGTLIVGMATSSQVTQLWKFRDGNWTTLSASSVLGSTPSGHEFAIWATKALVSKGSTIAAF